MSRVLNRKSILDISIQTGNNPAFIEKDWYGVRLLKVLNELNGNRNVKLIFCGGTSLSKGFGLIERFSEDLDFILYSTDAISAGCRRSFRRSAVSHIVASPLFSIGDDKVRRGNNHRYFKADVGYEIQFQHAFICPYLQVDMTFADPRLPLQKQKIHSIISRVSNDPPETEIDCVSPIETASDKISALTWRIVVRNRHSNRDDPRMVRHLHDLAALKKTILEEKDVFISLA